MLLQEVLKYLKIKYSLKKILSDNIQGNYYKLFKGKIFMKYV